MQEEVGLFIYLFIYLFVYLFIYSDCFWNISVRIFPLILEDIKIVVITVGDCKWVWPILIN